MQRDRRLPVSRSCRRLAEGRSGALGSRTFVGRCCGCCSGCHQVESSVVAGDDVTWGQFGGLQEDEMVRLFLFSTSAVWGHTFESRGVCRDPLGVQDLGPWTLQEGK